MAQVTQAQQEYIDSTPVMGGSGYYNPLSYALPGSSDNVPITVSFGKPMINPPAPPNGDLLCPYGCNTAERGGMIISESLGNAAPGAMPTVTLGSGRPPASTSYAPLSTSTKTNGATTMQHYLTGKNILLAIIAYAAAKHFKVI